MKVLPNATIRQLGDEHNKGGISNIKHQQKYFSVGFKGMQYAATHGSRRGPNLYL
ncbi:hypothetical protein MTR_3g070445 [Medicago truncatula]|uniref:Uncharacterized protein n=1 Tax=Medicago truncatula TaxID=3880 RepID=A0A072V082_MEDTR|nr:hypothetical protein MTR_3g070445 [Medicago truncatula]